MDTRIQNAAFQLAKSFLDASDTPLRFRQKNKESTRNQKVNTDSYIEKKFQEEVTQWSIVIETMLSKIDNTIAWRFINLKPEIPTRINSVANCKDFCDFIDYLVLRRDIEKCEDDELGRLAMWSGEFQRRIEKGSISEQPLGIKEVNIDFVAIDFETATSDKYSPCEIGLTTVKNGKIVEVQSWLIKPFSYPHFDPFNIMIHGIKPKDVANEPEFPEVWNKIQPLLENKLIIAHNAGFDLSVLRSTLGYYNLPFPNLKYVCSYIISKKVWSGIPSYDLKTLCQVHGISLNHHRAGNDSKACAELTLKALAESGTVSIDEFPEKLKTTIGQLYPGGYKPSESKRIYQVKNLALIVGDVSKQNPGSIFYGRTIVFTGTLLSMTRAEAQQIIADIGGLNGNTVTSETDYLIVGQQDYRIVGEDGMSSKQEKAMKLIEKGNELEVISEDDFLKNI
jgi:DNA polymerase III subunit epsilon